MWHGQKKRQRDHQDGQRSRETDPRTHRHLIFDRGAQAVRQKHKTVFSTNGAGTTGKSHANPHHHFIITQIQPAVVSHRVRPQWGQWSPGHTDSWLHRAGPDLCAWLDQVPRKGAEGHGTPWSPQLRHGMPPPIASPGPAQVQGWDIHTSLNGRNCQVTLKGHR